MLGHGEGGFDAFAAEGVRTRTRGDGVYERSPAKALAFGALVHRRTGSCAPADATHLDPG